MDKKEAVAAFNKAKSDKLVCNLHSEELYKENALKQALYNDENSAFEIGVAVFDKKELKLIDKYPAKENFYSGMELSVFVKDFDYNKWVYAFYCNDVFYEDVRADRYINTAEYGQFECARPLLATFDLWIDEEDADEPLFVKYEDAFVYQLHVRGFTKHNSSGTRFKGTFKGVTDKLDYLKALGITTIEFQPVNEFNECDNKTNRLNYWGYCRGYYYTPKAAYSYSKDSSKEFFDMVKAIHANKLEIILQMFFPKDFSESEMVSVLEYWRLKYHIDGFHILGENISLNLISKSCILTNCKIWFESLEGLDITNPLGGNINKRFALFRDDYMYSMRRFLKADEFSINDALIKQRTNNSGFGNINYFDSFNSFTLMDMVSYERKHNEENGEDNRDGSDYNCSWNCGEEGASRKTKVINLRKKQIKNALLMLLLSSGTPMICMGDEFGRTQNGNNNPYCHDSKITWLDWGLAKKQFNNIEFIKQILDIRKTFLCLHSGHELSMVDVSGCGYPEISYHGESAWKLQTDGYKHDVGIMFCDEGKLMYMAINMHWESVTLSMPRPPKGMKWSLLLSTDEAVDICANNDIDELGITVPSHSISIYTVVNKTGDK